MGKKRHLLEPEKNIIIALIDAADSKWSHLKSELCSITVTEMKDGGMGSVKFEAKEVENRILGAKVCEAEFIDRDGGIVSVV